MKYTEEELTQIEQLASLFIKISEMAVLLGKDVYYLKEDILTPNHPASKAYLKGKLAQKIEIHKQMATLARVGSPLAIDQSQKALMDMEDDEY